MSSDPSLLDSIINTLKMDQISKQPYSALGNAYFVKAKIYRIEELPSGSFGGAGRWTEILLWAPNKNSPLERSNIDFLYNGDGSGFDNDDIIYCGGYFAGIMESKNAFGGPVDAYVFVGDKAKIFRKHKKSYY